MYKAARQLGSEAAKHNLDAKTQRSEEAKSVSEAAKCNILLSPLEGEKKFLSELCELRNFREGYKKYKNSDRATKCAMTNVGDKKGKIKMNKNNLQQKQPNNPTAFTLAEVLITLGIIGVVATLTLPTLIQNYQKRAARIGRNPQTGKELKIPATTVPAFSAGKKFKDAVNK